MKRSLPFFGLGAALLLLCGCERLFDKGSRTAILEGEKRARAGDFAGAVPFYESALQDPTRAAEAHYRLALLYSGKLNSPVDALHHFNRYLTLEPKGTHYKEAVAYQTEGPQKVIAKFTEKDAITQAEALRLKNENNRLLDALAKARVQHAQELQEALKARTTKLSEGERKPIPEGARTYVVQPGDSFPKISMKFYNNRTKAKKIQDANFKPQLGTPIIKPGMVLVIP